MGDNTERRGTVKCFRLKLRQKPTQYEDNVITMLLENQEVKIVQELDEWLKVEVIVDGSAIVGYVASGFIKE